MCAVCVAQGITYVGGALGGLQVMAARAKARRQRDEAEGVPVEHEEAAAASSR